MRKIFLIVLVLSETLNAGFEKTGIGARSAAMSNALVGKADDVWAIYSNVGGLKQLKNYQASFFYSPQPFGMHELSESAIAAAVPFNFGVLGFGIRRYGFELYRELSWTLSYANSVKGICLGVNFNFHTVTIKNYGSANTIGIDVGMLVPVFINFQFGTFIKNINSPTIGVSREKLPQSFTTGVAYIPMNSLTLTLDIEKEINFDLNARFGFEYWIIDALVLRGGATDTPTQFSGGVGVRYSIFQMDYGFTTHQELGCTHGISITIQ